MGNNDNQETGLQQINHEETQTQTMTQSFMQADEAIIAGFSMSPLIYSSMKAQTDEERVILYNATNQPDKRISELINTEITIKDVYCQPIELTNEKTGEVSICPRIVLIDMDGVSYQAVSIGIYQSLRSLFSIFGQPTWPNGITVEIKQIGSKDRKTLTLKVIPKKK